MYVEVIYLDSINKNVYTYLKGDVKVKVGDYVLVPVQKKYSVAEVVGLSNSVTNTSISYKTIKGVLPHEWFD
jgi:hypothetical protein